MKEHLQARTHIVKGEKCGGGRRKVTSDLGLINGDDWICEI